MTYERVCRFPGFGAAPFTSVDAEVAGTRMRLQRKVSEGLTPLAAAYSGHQTTLHSHSAICAITSPNNNSAADTTSADTQLAIWKRQYGISKIPAASGTEARSGPKNRPMKILGTPQCFTKASPRGRISGYRDSGHIGATCSLYL